MTSAERRAGRYKRRRAKREAARDRANRGRTFEEVFTFSNLYASNHKCCLGVGWKRSTQIYRANAIFNVAREYRELMAGKFRSRGFNEFDIFERGKPRHIRAVHISERVVQRCLCDNALVPLLERSFIYDNGASTKNKGITFALNRLETHLHKYYRQHGTNGFVLTFDIHHFFDSIPHELFYGVLEQAVNDERLRTLTRHFIDMFGGDTGMGLGSQVSQIAALSSLNSLDHFIKEKLGIKFSARYMDDGYMIHHSKAHLQKCKTEIVEFCRRLGFTLNENKTQIRPLRRGVRYLKIRFILTDSGRVVRLPARRSITTMRHKLRTFRRWVDDPDNKFGFEDVQTSFASWEGHMKHCNSWRTRQRMSTFYNNLFEKELRQCIAS